MESRWFALDDAMELLTTSRRLTCRSTRIVSNFAFNSESVETRTPRRPSLDEHFLPQQTSSRRLQGVRGRSVFDYCDFGASKSKLNTFKETTLKPIDKTLETDGTDIHYETGQLRRKIQSVQEENLKLQAVITDLTQVNKRWQQYNNDRQVHIQKLNNTIQDQQEQLNQISERSLKKKEDHTDSSIHGTFSISGNTEVDRLLDTEQKLKEKIQVLEFQVKAYRDDWEAELNEKKQALHDKEVAEKKMKEYLAELQVLKSFLAAREDIKQSQYVCHCCGHPCQPPPNRLYRTAVHLPYSINNNSTRTTYIFEDDLVIDGPKANIHTEENISRGASIREIQDDGSYTLAKNTDFNIKDVRHTKPDVKTIEDKEVSYSRSSTVPLVSPVSQTNSLLSESSNSDETIASCCSQGVTTVTSFVQIPIAKSLSAPEGKTDKVFIGPRKIVDTIKFSPIAPPVSFVSSKLNIGITDCNPMVDGTETQTTDNVICPTCNLVFPPNMHLKFLDHFKCCENHKKD